MPEQKLPAGTYRIRIQNDENDDDDQDIFNFWPLVFYMILGMYFATLMYASWTSRSENSKHHRNVHH